MESVFSQIGLIFPAVAVSIFAVLVFVFGFKKPSPPPEFDKRLNLSESTKRAKKDKGTQNGDVKKTKKPAPAPEKKKEKETPKDEKKKKNETGKKTEVATPKQSAKARRAEENAQRKQEIKEFREMEQEGGGWNVVVSKKKTKNDDAPGTPLQEKPEKKSKKDNAKEIKDRVNNELKNEENIKAAISEIKEEITQPQASKKKRARHD